MMCKSNNFQTEKRNRITYQKNEKVMAACSVFSSIGFFPDTFKNYQNFAIRSAVSCSNNCLISSRSFPIVSGFKLSRFWFKQKALSGLIFGIKRSAR
jgi:ribosomal protein S14